MARVVRTTISTRFSDLDALGHVNNVTFLTYMETGRVRWFEETGVALHALAARSECDHRAEITAAVRAVDVAVHCEAVGRTSFTLAHELTVDGAVVAQGRVVMVKVGPGPDGDRRPAPVTDEERALLLGP